MREIIKPTECYICGKEGSVKWGESQAPSAPDTLFAKVTVSSQFYCPRCRKDFNREYEELYDAENALTGKIEKLRAIRY